MELNKENLQKSLEISINTSKNLIGNNCPQFKRIHHNFHHLVFYIKEYILKENCRFYLEIGSHYGHSFSNMLQSKYNSKLMTIDLFKKWGDGTIENIEELVLKNVNKFNTNNYDYQVIKGNSQSIETLLKVKEYFTSGIDLLFIDGDHSYNGIITDFNNYFSLVNSGGYIVFDDYLPYGRDATKAIDELIKKFHDKIEVIGLVDDIVECYKLKHSHMNFENKNIEFIIKKL